MLTYVQPVGGLDVFGQARLRKGVYLLSFKAVPRPQTAVILSKYQPPFLGTHYLAKGRVLNEPRCLVEALTDIIQCLHLFHSGGSRAPGLLAQHRTALSAATTRT